MTIDSGVDRLIRSPQYLTNYKLTLGLLTNRNYFVPRMDDPKVHNYLHLDRSNTRFRVDYNIPVGDGYIHYFGTEEGGINDRPLSSYQEQLFPDEFEKSKPSGGNWTAEHMLRSGTLKNNPERIFGGYFTAFAPNKTVLDLGSGQALGLLQLSLTFPSTCFIGIDTLYQQKLRVYPKKPGLQLTSDNWSYLNAIPDRSVDTILALQSLGVWGLPGAFNRKNITEEDGRVVLNSLNRVSRQGTILRIDTTRESMNFLSKTINLDLWEIQSYGNVFIAKHK